MNKLEEKSRHFFDWVATKSEDSLEKAPDFIHENARISDPLLLVSLGPGAMQAVHASWHHAFDFNAYSLSFLKIDDTTALFQWEIQAELRRPLQGVSAFRKGRPMQGCTRLEFCGDKITHFSCEVDLEKIFGNREAPFYLDPGKVRLCFERVTGALAENLDLSQLEVVCLSFYAMGRGHQFIGNLLQMDSVLIRERIKFILEKFGLTSRRALTDFLQSHRAFNGVREAHDLSLQYMRIGPYKGKLFREGV